METLSQNRYEFGETGPVTEMFRLRNLNNFSAAVNFVRQLPYGRNAHKKDLLTLFSDGCGTCSTKHALLKTLAMEQRWEEVSLFIGVFRMSAYNTPKVASVLSAAHLDYIPEAHCYLRIGGNILDATTVTSGPDDFSQDLMGELEILPEQITDFKVAYHRALIRMWLNTEVSVSKSPDELWAIREQCIAALSA